MAQITTSPWGYRTMLGRPTPTPESPERGRESSSSRSFSTDTVCWKNASPESSGSEGNFRLANRVLSSPKTPMATLVPPTSMPA